MKNKFYALLCAMLCAAFAVGAPSEARAEDTPPNPAVQIAAARDSVLTLAAAAESGHITKAQALEASKVYVERASQAAGHPMTLGEVMAAPDAPNGAPPQETGAWSRFKGFVGGINIWLTIAGVLGAICVIVLFGAYIPALITLFVAIPVVFYEGLFYIGGLGLLAYGSRLSPEIAPYVGLVGAVLFAGALGFTFKTRKPSGGGAAFNGILAVVWSIAAIVYGSSMLGFIAVGALLGALGFSVLVDPLCYSLGFESKASLGKATSAAFLVLTAFIVIRLLKVSVPALAPFETGALFLGSFVGYLGLLIASSRWYDGKQHGYVWFQIVTILAGVAAISLGSWLNIGELLKIGGTFFVLYLIEKLGEIPVPKKRHYAWIGLVICGLIYGGGLYAKTHLDQVRPYILAM